MKIMEQMNRSVSNWANVASSLTQKASCVKDWRLRRKADRRMKEIASEWTKGRGYIIATSAELEQMYPGLFSNLSTDTRKIIWAIDYCSCRVGNKMAFIPVR